LALTYNWFKGHRLFTSTVIVPTLLASFYYGVITSDIYISQSQFVVRAPDKPSISGIGAMLQNAGVSSSVDSDAHTVKDFILSRDALISLDQTLHYRQKYTSETIDHFNRFNGFGINSSFEWLFKYYQDHITVTVDASSPVVALDVQAFSAKDAKAINEHLLRLSEQLVNRLNERARRDMIGFAENEVARAMVRAKTASLAVSNYREKKSVFDPEKQSALQLELVSKMQSELIATKAQLAQLMTLAPENPQIALLQNKITNLTSQIVTESSKVTEGDVSFAHKTSEYERLMLEREFAGKQLAIAFASLEQARNEALRKHVYLERISQPNEPDYAVEPRKIRSIFAVFMLGLMVWGILSILNAGVREHYDR